MHDIFDMITKGYVIMKENKIRIISIIVILFVIFAGSCVNAHQGRTDSNGGHRDNKNKSGLGSYHYHCGGYPAHLHTNGECPYSTKTSSKPKSSNKSSNSNKSKNNNSKTVNSTNSAIEKNEKNTTNNIVKSYENNEVNNNIEAKDEENISDVLAGFTTLGLMGGGGYIAYKKLKNK